jgi:ketosteroid isomerase-like protein
MGVSFIELRNVRHRSEQPLRLIGKRQEALALIETAGGVCEVLYDFPGWPRVIQGRAGLTAQFRGYADNIALQSADKLITHKTDGGRFVGTEYEVHGRILATGAKYNNRFYSIIKIENRKIAHWRDYMDSLAAWNALTARDRRYCREANPDD